MKFLLPLLLATLLCAGCTNVWVSKSPTLDLSRYHRVFVEQPFNENHHIDELLVDELRRLGRESSSGPRTMMPDNADAILTYEARWTGDFKVDLLDLELTLRTAHSEKLLAEARYYQPSIRPKPPEIVVHRLVARLFAK